MLCSYLVYVCIFHRYYLHSIPQNKSLTIQQQTKIDRKHTTTSSKSTANAKHTNSGLNNEIEVERDDYNIDEDCIVDSDCDRDESEEEWFDGERISLTFRVISTFLHRDGTLSGQGAPSRSLADDAKNTRTASDIARSSSVHDIDDTSILAPSDIPVCISSGEYGMNGADSSAKCDKVVWIRHHRQLQIQQEQTQRQSSDSDSINATHTADEVILEKRRLLEAFSAENHQAGVLWEGVYTGGFGVW